MKIDLSKFKKGWLWHLIGPVAVVVAVLLAGPTKVWTVVSEAKLNYIAAAVAMAVPLIILKAIRWKILLRCYDIKLGFAESASMYSMGMVLSAITPGRLGDLIKIVMLIKKGHSTAKAIASNIIDRLLDIPVVLLTGYFGMLYFSGHFASQLRIINIAGVIILAVLTTVVLKRHLVKKIAIKLVPAKYHDSAKESWYEIIGAFNRGNIVRTTQIVLWTFLFWGCQFYAIYLCAMAVGAEINLIYMCACAAVAMLLSLLPITVAGVGTRDVVYILLLSQVGITTQQSIAISGLVLAVFLSNCIIFYLTYALFANRGAAKKCIKNEE